MQTILEVRENWYRAYRCGDTEGLRKYESPNLVVTVNGAHDNADRYIEIEERVAAKTWFQPELSRDECIDERAVVCSVSGRAKVREGKAKGRVLTYNETWKNIDSGWLLESLQIKSL